jgi:hypothetical protein
MYVVLSFPFVAVTTEFVELPGVGHCPQDEAPEVVNPLIEAWVLNSMAADSSSNGSSAQQRQSEAAAAVAARDASS